MIQIQNDDGTIKNCVNEQVEFHKNVNNFPLSIKAI